MNREFLNAYNRELGLLYERAEEFAEAFPGIAERLGGLARDKLDPGIAGLLEGAAFLAARVQLKIDSEFDTFTTALIEQLLPDYLAPTPSAMIVQARPDFADPDLVKGKRFAPGRYLDASYVEREQRVSCRYRLAAPLELWPLEIDRAEYATSPAPLQALGLEVAPGTVAGLRLRIALRSGSAPADPEAGPPPKGAPLIRDVMVERLPVYLAGPRPEMVALYEQLFASCRRVTLRWLDAQGDPVFAATPPGLVEQIGFEPDEALFPEEGRIFCGFALLREFHILPQKFLGFRLNGLRALLAQVPAQACDLMFEFDRVEPRLGALIGPQHFALHAAPAVNLFEESCSRIRVGPERSEYLVLPDSTPTVNYEVHRIREVFAHYTGERAKVPVWPVYSLPEDGRRPRDALYFAIRRRRRRLSERERRFGPAGDYLGTETLISLHEPAGIESTERVQRLQVTALCSNRHLPAQLPIGRSALDFRLTDDVTVALRCISGPTPPRDSIVDAERPSPRTGSRGERLWRLINFLAFNHTGLRDRHQGDPAAGLREVLALFADLSEAVTERQVLGIVGVASRPVTRSVRRSDGYHLARGIEVTLRFDERAFEGSGIALIGAVLDRFLADYTHINSFTETVIRSEGRGEVMRWPPRSGTGPVL
jgi:type VI secretion system protein ImpG